MRAMTARILLIVGALGALGACSSTSGGGSSPPDQKIIVVPAGTTAVCADGTAPPCR